MGDRDAKVFVDEKIANHLVVVFSKRGCPYSDKAKQTLSKYRDLIPPNQYAVVEIGELANCSNIQDYLQQLTGGRTVPRVFIKHKFVGGGDDVVAKDKSGELKALLA